MARPISPWHGALLLWLLAAPSAVSAQAYTITSLGLPEADAAQAGAIAINAAEEVAGSFIDGAGLTRGFVWADAVGFETLDHDEGSVLVFGITADGTVYGNREHDNDRFDPDEMDCFTARSQRIFTWSDGEYTEFGWLDRPESPITSCNSEVIVGNDALTLLARSGGSDGIPVIVEGGEFTRIWDHMGQSDEPMYRLSGITQDGTVFGGVRVAGAESEVGFFYDGSFHTFDHRRVVDGEEIEGWIEELGIGRTASGRIVGNAFFGASLVFTYDPGTDTFTEIGPGTAMAVNGDGTVVGVVDREAYVTHEGAWVPLETLLPDGHEWTALRSARAINEAGVIVGTGQLMGRPTPFLARPMAGASVDLRIALEAVRAPVGQLGIQVTVANQGGAPASDIEVEVLGPTGSSIPDEIPPALPSECEAGDTARTIRCTIDAIGPGAEAILRLRYDVGDDLGPFMVEGSATTSAPDRTPDDNMATLVVDELPPPIIDPIPEEGADVSVQGDGGPSRMRTVEHNADLVSPPFAMRVVNDGPERATNAIVTGSFPEGGAWSEMTLAGLPCSHLDDTRQTFRCAPIDIAAGESVLFRTRASRPTRLRMVSGEVTVVADEDDPDPANAFTVILINPSDGGCAVASGSEGGLLVGLGLVLVSRRRRR